MLDFTAIREALVYGLRDYIGVSVIRSSQTGKTPAYPYCSYTITTQQSGNNGTWGEYEDGSHRIPITQTWSFTFQSDKVEEVANAAAMAHDWLTHVGKNYLNERDIVVQRATGISNRDNYLTVEYENRMGFDVVFWLLNEVDMGGQAEISPADVELEIERIE